jgi:hypothetical protein
MTDDIRKTLRLVRSTTQTDAEECQELMKQASARSSPTWMRRSVSA